MSDPKGRDATEGREVKVPGREALKPELPRRFYKTASVAARDRGFAVLLDGRAMRTPSKAAFVVPAKALAEAIAEEWRAQGERIDPVTMPLTRIANSAIDGVAEAMPAVAADIAAYAGSDLLCYRAERPEELIARQAAAWDPILIWARETLGSRFVLSAGVMPVDQPPDLAHRVEAALAGCGPFELAALHVMTTLTGSALLVLAAVRGRLTVGEAWQAAHIDEDWQIERWGSDSEAAARRDARWLEMQAAHRMIALLADCSNASA